MVPLPLGGFVSGLPIHSSASLWVSWKFGKEPSNELVKKAEKYLYTLNDWIKKQGVSKDGITDYPLMPMVASVALAIAYIETNNLRNAIKALSKGGTRAIITRLRLNEFINQLANRETKS